MDMYYEEYPTIGGIEQYLLHYPVEGAPVLLFLHGGPGSPESNFSYLFQQWWGGRFTLVQWDQRGSGKTLNRNPKTSAYPITMQAIMDDVDEVVQYLKVKYGQEKIVLMGHSWGSVLGSVLGSVYSFNHPENVALYIAVGQAVNMRQNEAAGLQKTVEMAKAAGNAADVEKLKKIGEYPPKVLDKAGYKKIGQVRKLQQKYGLAMGLTSDLVRMFVKSPVFRLSDVTAMLFKAGKVNRPILNDLMVFDLEAITTHFEVPVCSIQGEQDYQTVTPLAVAYFEKVQAPAKQIHVIKEAGHATMADQPERFAAALREAEKLL